MNKNSITFKDYPGVLMERYLALKINYKRQKNQPTGYNINNYTLDELVILFELSCQEGLCQNEIAQKIHKNKSTVKRTIDKLEKKGAIVKKSDKKDSRKYNIYLDLKLKDLNKYIMTDYQEETSWYKECLGETEYNIFMKNLVHLYDKMLERYTN